jgi:serine protease
MDGSESLNSWDIPVRSGSGRGAILRFLEESVMLAGKNFQRVGIVAGVCAATAALLVGTSTGAVAANTGHWAPANHTMVMRAAAPRAVPHATLRYGGGPVEHNAKVYLVFWGSQWNSDANGVRTYLTNYFNGLGTSSDKWSHSILQYTDGSGHASVGNPVLGGTWVDSAHAAPANASQSAIASEANTGASHFGVSGPNVDVVVVSPTGTHPDGFPNSGFCAWHDWNGRVAYTNMPYVLDAGTSCGENSVRSKLDGFSIVVGHEYAEAATDPEPSSGWVASNGEENGDLCAWMNLTAISLPTGTFAVQPLWSNSAGKCVSSS